MGQMPYQTIWITGASDGIGRAVAGLLAQKSNSQNAYKGIKTLILSGRDKAGLNGIEKICRQEAPQIEVRTLIFDCADIEATKKATRKIAAQVDLAFLCAGLSQRAYSFDMDTEGDSIIYRVNFISPVETSKLLIKVWQKSSLQKKKILYVSSIAAHLPSPLRAMYSASKRALEQYSAISRIELKKCGMNHVQQAIVIPGFVNTNISKKALVSYATTWGKKDKNQAHGISAAKAAKKIIASMDAEEKSFFVGMNASLYVILLLYKLIPKLARKILTLVDSTDGSI